MKRAIAYIPVLHQGYLDFIERHCLHGEVYLIPRELLKGYRPIEKDIRALGAETTRLLLETWYRDEEVAVEVLTDQLIEDLQAVQEPIILPDEDVSRIVVERFFRRSEVLYETTFLRWDRRNTVTQQLFDHLKPTPVALLDKELLGLAKQEAKKSSDWWRCVGALIAHDHQVVMAAHNHHLPDEYAPYRDGDPRASFFKGVHLELSTAIHAEATIVAEAARRGISLEGADIYVTDFPCPPCAKLVAVAGIKRLFFSEGYAVLDGEQVLRDFGVEIIRVNI